MSDKGMFSGFRWHNEYHNVNPKKEKAADCIYLSPDRECRNKECYHYMSKCFVASTCSKRVKDKDKNKQENKTNVAQPFQKKIKKIKCSLPKGCELNSRKYGTGKYIGFNQDVMYISVQFESKILKFEYPRAILERYLEVSDAIFNIAMNDYCNAEVE